MSSPRSTRRERRLARQLPELAAEMARLVDAGSTLTRSLEDVARESAPPIRDELVGVVTDIVYGLPVDDALKRWLERSGRPDVMLLVAACRLGSAEGGNLVVALEGVSAALHDSLELAEEAIALTSQARASATALMVLPPFGLVMFGVLEPSVVMFVLGSAPGWVLLTIGGALDMLGAMAMILLVRWSLQ